MTSDTKHAIVTGASGDLGQAIVERLASDGYRLSIAVGPSRPLREARDAWQARIGDRLHAVSLVDLEDLAAVEAFANRLSDELPVVHGLVNCAGRLDRNGPETITAGELMASYAVNCAAPILLATALRRSLAAGGGSVVNIGSIVGRIAGRNRIAYAASKAALEGVTRALAIDLAPDVRVNCLLPGLFETRMNRPLLGDEALLEATVRRIPSRRIGGPPELAGAVAFLLGDDSRYVTGTTLAVDGGLLARSPLPAAD